MLGRRAKPAKQTTERVARKAMQERRLFPRYALNADVFVVFNPYPGRLGKLKDAGHGGVGFEYAAVDNNNEPADVEVDIFIPTSGFFVLRRMPCKVVYDIEMEQATLNGIIIRRCGLEFEPLCRWHNEQLKLLLDVHVSHPLPVLQVAGELRD